MTTAKKNEPKDDWTPEDRAAAIKAVREGRAELRDFPKLREECIRRGGLPNE